LFLYEFSLFVSDGLHDLSLLLFEVVLGSFVNLLSLSEDSEVELKFLVIQFEDGLHVFHAFLKGLHFLLKLNFLISLVVSVFASELFEFLGVILHLLGLFSGEGALGLAMLSEKFSNFLQVVFE